MTKPGLLTLTIKDKSALYLAYMPYVINGGLFIPTNSSYRLGDEVFMLLNLMGEDEKIPVAGTVIWMTPKGAQGKRTAGIGVQFSDQDRIFIAFEFRPAIHFWPGRHRPTSLRHPFEPQANVGCQLDFFAAKGRLARASRARWAVFFEPGASLRPEFIYLAHRCVISSARCKHQSSSLFNASRYSLSLAIFVGPRRRTCFCSGLSASSDGFAYS